MTGDRVNHGQVGGPTAVGGQVVPAQVLYHRLIDALRDGDQATVRELRGGWDEIREYAQEHEEDEPDLPKEKQSLLILWLSTPPAPAPEKWSWTTAMPDYVLEQRAERIAVADQLWHSWG